MSFALSLSRAMVFGAARWQAANNDVRAGS